MLPCYVDLIEPFFFSTLRLRLNGSHFADDICRSHFLEWNLIQISLRFASKDPNNNNPALVKLMGWSLMGNRPSLLTHIQQMTSHCLNMWWPSSLTHICELSASMGLVACIVARSQWVNLEFVNRSPLYSDFADCISPKVFWNYDTHSGIPDKSKMLYDKISYESVSSCVTETHWGRLTHICIGELTIIGSDDGLSPGWRQATIWTNAEILLIGPIGTNLSGMLIKISSLSMKKICLKMSIPSRPQCVNVHCGSMSLCNVHSLSTKNNKILLWLSVVTWYHQQTQLWRRLNPDQGPFSVTLFPSKFKFGGNFILLSH